MRPTTPAGSMATGWIVVAATVALDETTKTLARLALPLCIARGCPGAHVVGPVGFLRVENAGSALGLMQGAWWWILISVVAICSIPFVARLGRSDPRLIAGAALIGGGAAGNLLDRLLQGGATDFIDVGVHVIFNVADVALVLGCVLLSSSLWRSTKDADERGHLMDQVA